MSALLLVCSVLLLRLAYGTWFWGVSVRGGNSKYPQSLLDDVDDFDYVREREEIMEREAQSGGNRSQTLPHERNQLSGDDSRIDVEAAERDQGFDEEDRLDDEEVFFQGKRRDD